jgi:hypothetical protein
LEELKRADKPSAASLASAASEQVRAIVEAAETTAGDIRRQAESEADAARGRAQSEADKARAEAAEQARGHVAAVQEASQVMLERVDAMESELGALVESLRTGANRLSADLSLLQGNMGELRGAATGSEVAAAAAPPAAEPAPETTAEAQAAESEPETAVEEPEPEAQPEPEPEVAEEPSAGGDDSEGARLIALNMALNGTPREETDRYLAENFQLDDRDGLLDEVYARVG